MSDSRPAAELPCSPPQQQLGSDPSPLARLDLLRIGGAVRFDPARFHYLEVLARRLPAQPVAVRSILERKLNDAMDQFEQRFGQAQKAASDTVAGRSVKHPKPAGEPRRLRAAGELGALRRPGAQDAPCRPQTLLAGLNQYLQDATQDGTDSSLARTPVKQRDMRSVRRFRETWGRIASEIEVDHAVARGSENAGPLNSHALVLRSLELMRRLSPDYLRRFMLHVDSLLWLDQANPKSTDVGNKPMLARKNRPRK